jgi:hypothetical protein
MAGIVVNAKDPRFCLFLTQSCLPGAKTPGSGDDHLFTGLLSSVATLARRLVNH